MQWKNLSCGRILKLKGDERREPESLFRVQKRSRTGIRLEVFNREGGREGRLVNDVR